MKKKTAVSKPPRRQMQAIPRGWNEKRVRQAIDYYDSQSEDEELAEYEAAQKTEDMTLMLVPTKRVPDIRRLIGRRRGA